MLSSMSMSPTTPGGQGRSNSFGYNGLVGSPMSSRSQGIKRDRENSDDPEDGEDGSHATKSARQPAVKRACNECRQQKLRCDVQQSPIFVECSRCRKHNLTCVIEPNFKRVGKRSRHAEMEREIAELKQCIVQMRAQSANQIPRSNTPFASTQDITTYHTMASEEDEYTGSHQAVASLLDLRSGSPTGVKPLGIENVMLAPDRVAQLFKEYFDKYHAYLPFLDPKMSFEEYHSQSRLLFWTVVSVAARHFDPDPELADKLKEPLARLIWFTMQKVPQDHHVVKALCLLCTWPLPTSRTSTDPTYMYCGLMMQIAMQIGLHQPAHPQDFSRFRVHLRDEDIHDRMRTWAVCNIVAQTVSTCYGQPSTTLYNSTLQFRIDDADDMKVVPPDLFIRLRQEMAANRITVALYGNKDSVDADYLSDADTSKRGAFYANLEAQRFKEEQKFLENRYTDMEWLYFRAIMLHLRLYAFFDTTTRASLRSDLMDTYFAATAFLDQCLNLESEGKLVYAPNYIIQMILAAGFALLKLLNSEYAVKLPTDEGRRYFMRTVNIVRHTSVAPNDLYQRLAEVLAQLWKASGSGNSQASKVGTPGTVDSQEDALRLKVRSRMSMSVVFDSVWRWREAQVNGAAENLDSTVVNNPTNPESSSASTPPPGTSVSTTEALDQTLGPLNMTLGGMNSSLPMANSYEFFDSVSWVLDQPNEWFNYPGAYDFGTGI